MQRNIYLLALVVLLLCTISAGAVTIHVPADQPTIQAGIDAAVSGDTVLVAPGSYTQALSFGAKAITVRSSSGPDVAFLNLLAGVSMASAYGAIFEGFTVTACTGTLVNATSSICTIRNCRFVNTLTGGQGITGDGNSTVRVYHCLFKNATLNVVMTTIGPSCEFVNNTIDGGDRGLAVYGRNSIIKNNIITNLGSYGTWYIDPSTVLDYNDFFNNVPNYGGGTAAGAHDISQDPLFTDASSTDYALLPGSPCIDAGDPDPSYNDPDGTRNDMGAFPTFRAFPYPGNPNLGPENSERVISHTPRFYWSYIDTLGSQTGREVEVGTDSLWDIAEMWVTGPVVSSDTSVLYAGATLIDGTTYYWRVRVSNGTTWGDWNRASFHMNSKPSIPAANRPISASLVRANGVRLYVNNSTDAESDPLSYDFQVFSDPGLTTIVTSQTAVPQGPSPTASGLLPPLAVALEYWWRARAHDGFEYSAWSDAATFITRTGTIHVPTERPTIALGVADAWDGDTVLIAHGTYSEQINPLGRAMIIEGTLPAESTMITKSADGTDIVSIVNGEGSGTVIRDLTITGSVGANGVRIVGSSPQLLNNIIRSNSASTNGGGILIESGNPVIRGNLILSNSANGKGGGVFTGNGASVTLDSNSLFFNSSTDGGGAIAKIGTGNLTVTRNIIYGNSNTDDWGGIIYTEQSPSYLIQHNTIVGNASTSMYGTGITSLSPQGGQIKDNIVAFNKGGYGVYVLMAGGTAPTVTYNDLWANESGTYFGVTPGAGGIAGDPLLCDTTIRDFRLASGSPCLGTGSSGSNMGALGLGCTVSGPQPPTITDIEIGTSSDSLHVIDHAPRFSWQYIDLYTRPLAKSQIEVGSDMDWLVAEMWQPPLMLGPDTVIQYAGAPLQDGQTYYIRVRVAADTLWSNWLVAPFRMNSVPSAPTPLFPTPGSIEPTGRPSLVIMNATDAQNDGMRYDFEVYRDSGLTMLASYIAGVLGGPGQTSWKTDSLTAENQRHWWRARASDGHENGPWSPVWTFLVDAFNQPPAAFNLLTPANGAAVYDLTPPFTWDAAIDPDPGASLTYTLTIGLNSSFTFKSEISGITDTTFDWPDSLSPGTTYWWKVKADDGRGGTVTSAVRSFKTTSLGDENADGVVDVFDVIMLIDYVFAGGTPPNPASVADVNGDCVADVFDIIYLIDHVFSGGPAPVPGCG